MAKASPGSGRSTRAYVYTAVTTALVLLFALAEWAAEKFVAAHSRAAGTAVEVAIVLVATLVFRPIHQLVERAVDDAFTRRKRQALDALARFRRELTSFNDVDQLLRRVVEAVDHQADAQSCAVYVRKEHYRAAASSFDVAAIDVSADDPLVVRLRSSGAPASPPALGSAALGTLAFPMTAAGGLTGFLCVQFREFAVDEDEAAALSAFAHDVGVALLALDPKLRPPRAETPNNLPAEQPRVIGREREVSELRAALESARLVTITGPGGVGKTSVALRCAADALRAHEDGAWFVGLAPIADGKLVPATILGSFDERPADDGDDLKRLVDYLKPLDVLIVLDNCEQVIDAAAAVVKAILAGCSRVTLLATSRELLRVEEEHVYPLGSLRPQAAVELFAQRAAAVSPGFDTRASAQTVQRICERLDFVPLAIELAAARVRTLSPDEILAHLHERFRLLSGGARTAPPRQQTLEAPIQWSYDLLSEEEQALFRRLGVFRGSFTFEAASGVCGEECGCDEYAVLDRLTSLSDKSLLNVRLGLTTRYRLLETIREFAQRKAREAGEADSTSSRHVAYFAAVAAQAYHEFDTRMPAGWKGRLAPDLDNFRAALEWTLQGGGERLAGASLAADCGPIFLRMGLLAEGVHWCDAASRVAGVAPGIAGRIHYVASMMHNNALSYRHALEDVRRSVAYYRESSDERGLVRALSQNAHQAARAGHIEEAQAMAEEAIECARRLAQPRLLVAVLRRCALALPPEQIERAQALFGEALEIARGAKESEEACYVLQWWGVSEGAAGNYERAMSLAAEALRLADADMKLYLETDAAGYALAHGALGKLEVHARNALALAAAAQHPVLLSLAIAYCAPVVAQRDPERGARLLGYAEAGLRKLQFEGDRPEHAALKNGREFIRSTLRSADLEKLLHEGAELDADSALELLRGSALRVAEGVSDTARDGVVA